MWKKKKQAKSGFFEEKKKWGEKTYLIEKSPGREV
jgi:hypothetical protein